MYRLIEVISKLKRRRALTAMAATLLVTVGSGARFASDPVGAAGASRPWAHMARTLKATDTAHLHYVSASGSLLNEEGRATGTLPGSMKVHFDVGVTLSGSFTIYTAAGTIKGHGEATPHGAGVYESFAGHLIVTGGTGRYAHAHGRTGLDGTFDRDNYALVINTSGTLSY